MSTLRGSQRKYLRGQAHSLKPVIQIGKEGLTEKVLTAIDTALTDHELIKVKLVTGQEEKHAFAQAISEKTTAECVGLIGHVIILYRQQEDVEKRRISLPS
jgi:RNA-binding protein